jgi:hypothetical protein
MDMLLAACVTAASALVALRILGIAGRAALPAARAFVGLALLPGQGTARPAAARPRDLRVRC